MCRWQLRKHGAISRPKSQPREKPVLRWNGASWISWKCIWTGHVFGHVRIKLFLVSPWLVVQSRKNAIPLLWKGFNLCVTGSEDVHGSQWMTSFHFWEHTHTCAQRLKWIQHEHSFINSRKLFICNPGAWLQARMRAGLEEDKSFSLCVAVIQAHRAGCSAVGGLAIRCSKANERHRSALNVSPIWLSWSMQAHFRMVCVGTGCAGGRILHTDDDHWTGCAVLTNRRDFAGQICSAHIFGFMHALTTLSTWSLSIGKFLGAFLQHQLNTCSGHFLNFIHWYCAPPSSTGMHVSNLAISLTLYPLGSVQICDEVHMYGFSNWKKQRKGMKQAAYHYFDKVQGVTNVHSFDMSLRIYQRISQEYSVFLH